MSRKMPTTPVLLALGVCAVPFRTAVAEGHPRNPVLGPSDLCLPAMLLAILTEGAVLLVLGRIRKKPARRLLVACVLANVITVTALTLVISLAPVRIWTLVLAELVIWLLEAAFLVVYPRTGLSWLEGLVFSLSMNASSLLAGWAIVALLG